jgi:hypothetical protein
MNMLPFYMFLEITGTMGLYQASLQYWTSICKNQQLEQ